MSIWQRLVARAFHRLYYNSWKRGHRRGPSPATLSLHFLGHQMIKCPFDLWVYQELVVEQQPDWVIECGTFRGGTALYFAVLMDAIGHGGVIAIDTTPYDGRPEHSRIRYVHG